MPAIAIKIGRALKCCAHEQERTCAVVVRCVGIQNASCKKHENCSKTFTNNNNNNMIYITTKREITQTFMYNHAPTDERTQKN